MLNEYNGLTLDCMDPIKTPNPYDRCDPLKAFNSPQDLPQSIGAIVAMYVGCYLISWMIMIKLSTKYE